MQVEAGAQTAARGSEPGVRHPLDADRRIRAVLFDLDGTLYAQRPLRVLMAMELLTLPFSGPGIAVKRWRALAAYRHAQEQLRTATAGVSVAAAQIALASEAAALPAPDVERLVQEWMLDRPMKYLRWCRSKGVDGLLDFLAARRIPVGILSDYPAEAKLEALGLAERFSPVICTTDADVGALKPHPRGFLRACERWGLSARDVLMVGDRLDADAAGAAAAGMPCVIIGRRAGRATPVPGTVVIPSFERLRDVLDDRR